MGLLASFVLVFIFVFVFVLVLVLVFVFVFVPPIYNIIRCILPFIVPSTPLFSYFLKISFMFLCWFAEKSYLCTRKTGTTPTDWRSWFSYAIKERVLWKIFVDRNCSTSAIFIYGGNSRLLNLSIPFSQVVQTNSVKSLFYNASNSESRTSSLALPSRAEAS